MNKLIIACAFVVGFCFVSEAKAQFWLGGQSYSLSVNKYDSYYGQAKPVIWNCGNPRGRYWWMPKCFSPSQVPTSCRTVPGERMIPRGYRLECNDGLCYIVPDVDSERYNFGEPCGNCNKVFSRRYNQHPTTDPLRHSHHVDRLSYPIEQIQAEEAAYIETEE